jgi:protocatechuate 3,4-dioxygenase beta subunit
LYNVEQYGHPRDKGVALVLNGNGIWEGKKDFVLYAQYDKTSASSGLLKDEECPAFGPRHVWGRDKGSTACPMCKYGYGQGIMAWINTDSWSNITKLATFLDRKIEEQGADKLRAFLIFMNPERLNPVALEKRLQQFAKENKLKHVAVLCIPSPQDEKSAGLYRINPNKGTRNTVFIYKSRRVFDKYVNFDVSGKNVTAFTESIQKAIQSKQQL